MKKCIAWIFIVSILMIALTGCTKKTAFNLTAQIDEQVIYDQNGIVIKALSLETITNKDDGETMLVLNVHAENNSSIEVQPMIYNTSINGILTCTDQGDFYLASSDNQDGINKRDDYFILGYVEDASGIYTSLADMGIADAANISFDMVLTDLNLFNPNTPGKDAIAIEHVSLQTNIADKYTQEKPNPDGQVIYDQNNIRIVSLGLEEKTADSDYWGSLLLFVENNSEEKIMLKAATGTRINEVSIYSSVGWMTPFNTIPSGSCAYIHMRPSFFGVDMSVAIEKILLGIQINNLDDNFNVVDSFETPLTEITLK